MKVLLADRVVTVDPLGTIYGPGAVALDGRAIAWVGPAAEAPAGARVDLRGSTLLPGLINTHTHSPMWLYRGLTEDVPRGAWLSERMPPIEARYGVEALVAGAHAGCLEMLLNGTTTIADRYAHMECVADTVEASGLRAVVGHSLYDHAEEEGLAATCRLVERFGTDPDRSRVWAGIAPHATDSCGTRLLRAARELADRTGARLFVHVAQSAEEVAAVRARGLAGCVDALGAAGLLAPDVVAAHCTYLSDTEAEALGAAGVKVAHCPSSNAKLEGRVAPLAALRRAGAVIGLGTDAACCSNGMDVFEEMKVAGLLHKVAAQDPAVSSTDAILRMATIDAARVLGIEHLVGSIEVGKRADLVAVGGPAPSTRLAPWHDPIANLVYAARGRDVRAVYIDGELLVDQGVPTRLDPEAILAAAMSAAQP